MLLFGLIMLDNQHISQSQFPPIIVINHHASLRTPHNRRLTIILPSTAMTTMYEKFKTSATHIFWDLGIEEEGAGAGSCLVHHVFAVR
jgi:hypothetical protein